MEEKNKKLVVAVVGVAIMGELHLKGILDYENAVLGAICDSNPDRLKTIGDRYGIPEEKRYSDHKQLLNDPDVEAVVLSVPDQLHLPMSEEFLAAGKHVLCEKPLALTRSELDAIIAAANKSDRTFMVGQICRFTPAFVKAKEIIDAGTIGELYFVESEYAHDYETITHTWRGDPNRHGVVGGGCHAVDLLRWIAGDPEEVFAYGVHKLLPHVSYDDATISVLKFPNKVVGKIFVSTGCKRDYTMRTLFYGTKGTIICDNHSKELTLFTLQENSTAVNLTPTMVPIEVAHHNTTGEFKTFADIILNGEPLVMTAVEGAKTVAACMAIVESSKTGKPVKPDYNF
ncbi:MAG: Gfo/Idh/MocA family oxidoreductase [Ruminococcaceae bacterium]|nr:Gfo/Idh/MocA family oxidoreductase [Oscillospiraceae bacterium]